jgi:uncharacterized protein
LSRYHMFLMVYFHHKAMIYDRMLSQYLNSKEADYHLPADMDEYVHCTDSHIENHLAQSTNPWAKRIAEKRPFKLLIEMHSAIPPTRSGSLEQRKVLAEIEAELKQRGIFTLSATSKGQLSKYYAQPTDPIFVKYDNGFHKPQFIPLEQCTDLFEKYRDTRFINRLYVAPEDYSKCRI